jgi:hypothetical protein
MDAAWGFIGVIIGGLITGIATMGVEYMRGRQASSLDDRKRQDDRRIERDRIQRDTLLDLQPATVEWTRTISEMQLADLDAIRRTGRVASPYPGDLADREMLAGRRFMYLVERVRDDGLRDELRALRKGAWDVTTARTEADVNAAAAAVAERMDAAMTRLGATLRNYL